MNNQSLKKTFLICLFIILKCVGFSFAQGQNKCLTESCHSELAEKISRAKVQHSALEQKDCTYCHFAHEETNTDLTKRPIKDICCECHKYFCSQIMKSKNIHRPIAEGKCILCHDPHGSEYQMILRKNFPRESFLKYKNENYALCWQCHDKETTLSENVPTLTAFRNGNLNLHFVHVVKGKGRSCKSCHDAHAGNQEMHMFSTHCLDNKHLFPVIYTKTLSGGSCVCGCHREFAYDRNNPVKY